VPKDPRHDRFANAVKPNKTPFGGSIPKPFSDPNFVETSSVVIDLCIETKAHFSLRNIFRLMITGCLRENRMRRSFIGDEPESKWCRSMPEDPASLKSGQLLFQSVNSVETGVTGRSLNRYSAWAAIRRRAKAQVFSLQ
jgi:hypothetical protein